MPRRQPTGTRCPECRKPVLPGQPSHSVEHPAGTRMGLVHRMVTSTWHASCWADVEKYAAESRARAEEARLATIRAIAEDVGIAPADVSRIAREMGTPDPYA